jgi:hypothetical protein
MEKCIFTEANLNQKLQWQTFFCKDNKKYPAITHQLVMRFDGLNRGILEFINTFTI